MGHPVVHFEIVGKDGDKLQSYYAELFGWDIDADNEMRYGLVQRGQHQPRGHRNRGRYLHRSRGLRRPRDVLRRGARRRGLLAQAESLAGPA